MFEGLKVESSNFKAATFYPLSLGGENASGEQPLNVQPLNLQLYLCLAH